MIVFSKKKFKKSNKGHPSNRIKNQFNINLLKKHTYSLKSLDSGRILFNQLKSVLQVIKKIIKKRGFIKFSIYSNNVITKKPIEVRMGKGKGALYTSITKIFTGMILVTIVCSNKNTALKALVQGKKRLNIASQII